MTRAVCVFPSRKVHLAVPSEVVNQRQEEIIYPLCCCWQWQLGSEHAAVLNSNHRSCCPLILCHYQYTSHHSSHLLQTMAKNPIFAIIWLVLLFFLAWPIAAACAGVSSRWCRPPPCTIFDSLPTQCWCVGHGHGGHETFLLSLSPIHIRWPTAHVLSFPSETSFSLFNPFHASSFCSSLDC